MHPLFREPLRFDVLTWLWWVLVGGVYVAHLRLDTWVSAWAFIVAGVVVASAFTLLVALLRYLVDGPQRRVEGARTMREVLGIDVLPGVGDWTREQAEAHAAAQLEAAEAQAAEAERVAALEVERDEVTVALPLEPPTAALPVVAAEPAPVPVAAGPVPTPVAAPVLEAPRALRLEVSEVRIPAGRPVTVTWSLEGADTVVVDGRPGFPSHGQTTVAVRETRHVLVVGSNAAGVTAVTTPEIEVVPEAPEPAPLPPLPPEPQARPERRGPAVHRLQIDLGSTTGGSTSALAHLDRVLAAQDRLRSTGPDLPGLGVPESFGRWLRGHPRSRFVRAGSYLPPLQPGRQAADTSLEEVVAEPDPTATARPVTAEDDRTTT
ncbi:hypothetical protein GCM10028777_21550 [Angustibacter speluncae]